MTYQQYESVRAVVSQEIDRLITMLDLLDSDADVESDLGSLDREIDQTKWASIHLPVLGVIDGEADYDEQGAGSVDDEDGHDAEENDYDREHSLGAPDSQINQERWAQGDGGDFELVNEDGAVNGRYYPPQATAARYWRMVDAEAQANRETSARLGAIIARLTGVPQPTSNNRLSVVW